VKDDDIPVLRIEMSRLASRTVPGNAVAGRKLGSPPCIIAVPPIDEGETSIMNLIP
jgi:hypothetical protein